MTKKALGLLPVLLCACSGFGPLQPSQTANTEPQQDPAVVAQPPVANEQQISVLQELYDDIDAAVIAYKEAIELLQSGSIQTGENLIEDAIAGLDETVNRCRVIEGCELDRALRAYQDMISLQAQLFGPSEDTLLELPSEEVSVSGGTETVTAPSPSNSTGAQLNGAELAELITQNRYVEDAIHDWLTWNRPLLMQTYENFQFLKPQMLPAYEKAGMPEALLFGIMAVESGGKVHAYSRAGAAGLLQFMRATGRRYGLSQNDGFDERLDPTKASEANVAYLNDQFRRLDFSLEKTLAAYNAGENRLKRLNRKLKGKDFWSSEFFYALPRDTRDYVPKVMAATWLYLHADQYNLSFPEYEFAGGELVLDREMSLSELTICLGNRGLKTGWFRTLRNLNPQVKPADRLPAGTAVKVPQVLLEELEPGCTSEELLASAKALHEASYAEESDMLPYVIQRGDTMSRIASRHRCMSLREIAALNNIAAPRYLLRAGKTIKVPNC